MRKLSQRRLNELQMRAVRHQMQVEETRKRFEGKKRVNADILLAHIKQAVKVYAKGEI